LGIFEEQLICGEILRITSLEQGIALKEKTPHSWSCAVFFVCLN